MIYSKTWGELTVGSYSIPVNPPAAKFASQGDAHVRTNAQIKFLYYSLTSSSISCCFTLHQNLH